MPSKPRSCIIIGAGLAGLSAGYRLRKRGWNVTMLEALQTSGGQGLLLSIQASSETSV
jgi:monoamine oxidase